MLPNVILSDVILPVEAKATMVLLIGNILIGLIESLVVFTFFHIRQIRLPVLVILANYISSIVGAIAIGGIADLLAGIFGIQAFYHVMLIGVILIAIYWVLSVLIEWPLFHLSFPKPQRKGLRTLAATTIAQTVSYALIVVVYLELGNNSLRHWHLEHNAHFVSDRHLKIIYAALDGSVKEMSVATNSQQIILPAGSVLEGTSIYMTRHEQKRSVEVSFQSASNFQVQRPVGTILESGPASRPVEGEGEPWGWVQRANLLNGAGNWDYDTRYDFDPSIGLVLVRTDHSDRAQIAVDFFGLSWWAENATLLPNDQLVMQLGPQIVLADLKTRQITALTLGEAPVVVLGSERFVPVGSATTQPAATR